METIRYNQTHHLDELNTILAEEAKGNNNNDQGNDVNIDSGESYVNDSSNDCSSNGDNSSD